MAMGTVNGEGRHVGDENGLVVVITRGGSAAKGGMLGARTAIVVRDNKGRATEIQTNGGWTE